jgi:proline iminopeptidase
LPHAGSADTNLSGNTTENLISDIELLRVHLNLDRWLVLGGSWGSALALAYSEEHPTRVTELILFGVTTGRREEFNWLFRDGLGVLFPEEWERRRNALPVADRDGDVVGAYRRLLSDLDPETRKQAALAWCLWESATPDWPPVSGLADRFCDPSFAMGYARLVTHYVYHDAWLGDGRILSNVDKIAGIPGVLINGRFDFQAPIATAWALHRSWPRSELVIVDNAGHAAGNSSITQELVRATDRFKSA